MNHFIIRQLVATTAITLLAIGLYFAAKQLFPAVESRFFYVLAGWFFFQDFMLGSVLRKAHLSGDPSKFVTMFQIAFTIKFIFSLIILVMLVVRFPAEKRELGMHFLALYIFFLIADTLLFISLLKRKKQS